MSSRRSKKNQKFGSSRRVNRGLRVDEEKDNEFDGQDEVHTTSPSDDTVLEARFDHLPSLKTDNQTTALECSPHAESPIHKDSYVEAELPERKRKIGSTRKKVGGFNSGRNLEPCDEVRTTEEFGEEQETQLNTSTTEEHTYPTKDEHRNASSDLWQQTQRSGSGGELGVAQNIMVTVSQSKETDAIHHQEISSYSQISSLEAGRNMAMEQSTAQSNVVAMAKTDHKTLLASTSPKRKMGMTRRPLGGNREQNRENVAVQELLRNTTDDVWKAEVKSSEAEFSMLEEMMQTWDDVKRIIPTNTSSHTESPFVSNQPLSSERTEELDVSAETETNNQSVACSVVDPAKPPSDRFNNHETIFLNKEIICYNVFQNVTDSPPTRSENVLIDVGGCSDTYQDVPDSRHNTSEDCGSVKLVETKEEPCRSDPKIIISSSKQDTEIDKLVVNVEEPLSSLCPLDVATKDGNFEISTDVLTAEVSRISETLESDITHAEPATVESTLEMTDPGPGSHGLEDEEKETLKESSTSGQEMKMEEEYTQSKELEHKEENMNIQATDDFVEQEMQSEVQQGKTRNGLEKHSANETNISDSSLCSANCNLANVSPVTERLQNVNMNLSSLLPEDSKLSCDVMIETMVCSRFNDLIINNEDSLAIVPEAENREIYVEIKEGNDIDVIERSITCDVTVTEIVMDVENLTEQSVDPQTLAARENENVGTKTGPETDALEINDQDNVENNAKDDIMQILKDERENEEEEGDTKDQEQQPASQIQGRPSRVDPDKESYDFIRDASVENAEESLLNAKSESAFDGEDKTCEKYKIIEESGGKRKLDESAVTILDVINIPDNDIRSDLQMEKNSSDIHFDALMLDAATESSSAVSKQTEISIIPEDSQGVQKKDGDSEGLAEKDKGPEFPEQNNVIDQNIKQTMMVVKDDEHDMTETVRKSTQELCEDEPNKAEGHAEITSEQQLRSSLNISQKQDGPPQDDSEHMLEIEAEEMFLRANTVYGAFERMIKTNDQSKKIEEDFKETEVAEHLTNVNIQDNANQSDLQTENPELKKVLTGGQNNTNLEELQESEHAKNVSAVTDSGLSFEDSGESHKELENINEIPKDSQKEEKQSKIKPLVHKRKIKGNKGQRKDREQDDESETLNNEEKEQQREISGEKTGPVEEMDSTIIQSSCNAEKSTEESISDITESQTTTKCQAESQETAEDVASLPVGGDTEAHLEIQTDIKMFDSTPVEEGTEENICDDDVLMRYVEFVENTLTVDSNMTIESEFLQNNTSLDTHQEALKSSENAKSVFAGTDSGLLLKDVVLVGSGETEAVSEKTEISITSENSQRDSSSTLNPLAHKRKMGSTRRPLRGNKGQRKDREQDDESETLNNEEKEQEREISGEKDTGPVEVLDSTIIQSSCNAEKSTEESICDVTESQTTTKCQAESQETTGDNESLPAGGDTEAHLEIQTDIKMFDSTMNKEGTEENICDDDVLMRQAEFVGDKLTVESNLTIESDLLQNNTSLDTNQEALKSSEIAQNVSAVTDSDLPLKDCVLVGSGEKTKMSIISDNSQGDSPSKLNPLAHKRKMGSTRRPLRGNKEKIKSAEEKEDEGSEGVAEEDTDLHAETQEQNNVIDDNIIQTIDVSDNEEHEMTETVRKSTQELCDDAADKAEITSEQQLRSSSNIWQTQDCSPQDDSENMLESEMDVREEKDEETENTVNNIEATKSEEIFAFEDINSEVTVTPQTQNQLFIQTTDEDVHDYIQTVKDVYEESGGDEMFLSTNTDAAFDSKNETKDESKETEDLEEITNLIIQDNDSQLDLQTENTKQNKVLTEEQNTNATLHINLAERQETEHAENVFAVTNSGLSLGDSGESHKELENVSEIPEDSQNEEKQSKIKPLVHKRKMGSTRRPLRGNKGQRKDREQDDESETLNNEEKEQEREISGEKDTGPVEVLDSTIIQSSCNAEKSTEESICDVTESQTTTKCQAESQETIGDNESLPAGGDTEAHLEIQTDIKIFDSTMNKEGTEENICDTNVLMRHAEFVENTLTVDSNMTIESEFLQNNTSLDTHQEALKSSENFESVFAGTDSGLLLKDVVLIGSGETEAVSEKTEISITSENSQRDSSSTLNPLAHKRKMGSTRRQLRGNKGQRKDREQDDENETLKIESLINEEKSTEESICDVTDSQTNEDNESLPAGGDTEAHLEIQTDIKMFDSTIIEGTEENICDDDVLMRHVEFVGDTFTVESNLTIESDFLQNNTSLDTNQEALKSSENAQNVSAVTETGLPLKDCVLVGSVEKTEMSIYPPAHKRKMGSTRRPLRGNKEKIKSAEEKEDEGSKGVAEEDTDLHAETQEQNKVIDDNIIQTIDVSDDEEHEMTETVRKSTQELCDDAADKAEGHAEITSEQQLRSSSNIWQTQDGSPQDDSENMLESEMDVREEKETENTAYDEEIFAFEDINSRETVTPQAQNQLFIQTTDEDIHDYIQTVKDVYEESQGKEMFLSANTNLTIRNNDSRSDLQTENPKQNKVLTEDQNTNSTPQINQEERQETESNVFAVTDSGLSIGDSGESHTKLENISKIPEDSQKIQSKLNPLVHKRKMGSKRRPTRGNKEQRKDREWPEESQKNAGDVASVPVGGDTEAHLEIQTEIKTFDSTVEEGKKDNIYDNDVPMRQAEFVGDKLTVESNMTIESEFLQNNTSLDTNQEALKSSENVEIVSTVIHSGLVLQDVATESSLESNTVPEKTEISIIPEDSHVEDSHLKLNAVVHKRKLGSTRRPLRGNKDKEDLREAKEEDMEPHSEIQEQNNVIDHDTMQKIMDVRHNEEKTLVQELCEHLSENKEWHSDITLEQEQTSSSNISQTQTAPSQDDAYENLPEVQESNTLVLSEALLMEEIQINVSEPVVTVGTPQIGDGKIQSVFSRSVQKRKMGSTRKTQRGQRMEKERELGEELDGETKNATTKEDTIKPQENFILEEVMSLTITGTHAHQQPSSLPSNKEGHDIENNGSKLDNQTENSEQTERQEQNDPNSNTNSLQNHDISEIIIYEKSHTENIQSNMNPTAQKRKMGSTRKTLRGNGRRTREVESKEIDGDSERTSEGHSTEFATIEREPETKLDENPQFKETRNSKGLTHSVATSKIFFETEDIVGLSVVSEEIQSKAPSEAFSTDLQSEMLVSADEMKVGEKYDDPSELENLDKSKSLEEVESKHQLQTVLDQSHHVVHSEKHPRSETVTPERRRKMGSTRKNVRGNREEKTREESESNQFAPEEDQDGETSIIREAERYQIIHDSFEQSDSSLLSEIERALRKTSPSSQSTDYQLIVNEPNLAKTPLETSHFNTPENSESEQGSDKEKYVSLQVTESQNPSEISSPGRRRKMGSTRKNPRQQLQAKREDEHKEDETEQEPTSLKKDLEAAEESKMHDSRDNEEHKEYLDVPVTLTNSCQTEERTNPAGQEGTSPSTKRKFGSRRTNVGKNYLGGLIPPESNDDLTEDTGARLVSLDQMIKASQHAGKKQTADLKNISDMEVVQFNVVMVGNSSVGKTSFVRRFHGGEFSPDYSSTIGVDTCVQNVVFHDKVVKLQIWDTAGQERFHSITTQVFHRADGLFLMYEITSSKSFISVRDWISQIQEKAPDDVIMILLGNKNDCAGREVQVQEGEDLAREYNINFMECSAATGDNVSECMRSLAEMLVQRKRQKMEEHTPLKRERPQKKSGCC